MRATSARVLAWSLLAISALMSAIAIALVIANPERASAGATIVTYCAGLSFPVVGVMIATRQPANPIGWLFIAAGLLLSFGDLILEAAQKAIEAGSGSADLLITIFALGGGAWAPALGCVLVYPLLLFPDGHVLTPRWRIVVWLESVAIVLILLGSPFSPESTTPVATNPLAHGPLTAIGGIIQMLGSLLYVALIPVAAVSLVLRFRRSRGIERDQMKWFVFGGAVTVGAVLIAVAFDTAGHPEARANIIGIAIMAIPLTAGIAMLRYRLWDIDVVIKKTLMYGSVVVGLTVLSAAVLLLLPVAVVGSALTGWERGLFIVGIAVGTLFGPLRRVARRVADRLVYGKRATPYEVLTAFAGRIGETYATEDVLPRMAHVLASGTGAASARVLLQVGGELQEVARHGEPEGDEHVAPVVFQGEELGALAVTMPANDPMTPTKEKLVEDLATQAGPVLRNVRLIEDLKASRQRLVAAQDEERRRIERNIHDGAQQQLVALAVQLKLAEQMVDRDAEKAKALLGQMQGAAGSALEDLRDLARGIYPPLLADRGLTAAIEAQARKAAVPTTVEADGIGRFPEDVEATVYFCTLEALNNIAKYANATHATVRMSAGDGHLRFEVHDDGDGFDTSAMGYGTGLHGMADRLAVVGGELTVVAAPGEGTTIAGTVPSGRLPT